MKASAAVATVAGGYGCTNVGHDNGTEGSFLEDLCLIDFSSKLPFLDNSCFGIPPQLPDDASCRHLRINVEDTGEPGDVLPLGNPVPGEPRSKVVQEEGDEQHRCEGRVVIILHLLWDSSKASRMQLRLSGAIGFGCSQTGIVGAVGMIGEASVKLVDEGAIGRHVCCWETYIECPD